MTPADPTPPAAPRPCGATLLGDSRSLSRDYRCVAPEGHAGSHVFEKLRPVSPEAALPRCDLPPDGWLCTRKPGHDGPCAAVPCDGEMIAALNVVLEAAEPGLEYGDPILEAAIARVRLGQAWVSRVTNADGPEDSPSVIGVPEAAPPRATTEEDVINAERGIFGGWNPPEERVAKSIQRLAEKEHSLCASCGREFVEHGPPHDFAPDIPSCPPPSLTGTWRAPHPGRCEAVGAHGRCLYAKGHTWPHRVQVNPIYEWDDQSRGEPTTNSEAEKWSQYQETHRPAPDRGMA